MRIDFAKTKFMSNKISEKQVDEKPISNAASNPVKKVSYLDIPKLAFSGHIARIPDQDKLKAASSIEPMVMVGSRFNLAKSELPQEVESQMFVNPQDPLVTKPELMTLCSVKGFKEGPEGERVKIIDYGRAKAKPNLRGNFIYPMNSTEFDQVNSFALVSKAFKMHEDLLGRKIHWAFPSEKLRLFPHAGEMANAYYSREEGCIKLFEFMRPDNGKIVKTCQSSDVVTHETGHATLDGAKPNFMTNFGFGVAGYHEAFADTTAMLVALQNDSIINRMLEATKGDLKKENIVSCLAEEFGDAIHKNDYDPRNDSMQYLRNAINFFKQKPYKEMPFYDHFNDDTVLGLESHSYSRLFLGAGYDVLVGIYDKLKKEDNFDDQKFALMTARDIFAKIFTRALDFSPAGEVDFKDMALAMVKADKIDYEGKNREILEKVFIDRNILTADDLKKLDEDLKALPELVLPSTITSEAEITKFVEDNKQKLGLPENVTLKPAEGYGNSKGEKHVVFLTENPVILQGEQFGKYQGEMVNIEGSVLLTFDKDGKLTDKTVKTIDNQVKEDVLYSISLMIKNMSQNEVNDSMKGLKTLEAPQLLAKAGRSGRVEISKPSMIVDKIDPAKRGPKALAEYFLKLKKQIEK